MIISNVKALLLLATLPFLSKATQLQKRSGRSLQEQTCAKQTDRLDTVPFNIQVSLLTNAATLECSADDVQAINDVVNQALLTTPLSEDLGTVVIHGKVCAPEEEGHRALQLHFNINYILGLNRIARCNFCYPDNKRRLRAQRRAVSTPLCGCNTLDFQTNPITSFQGSQSSTLDTSHTSSHGITITTSAAGIKFDFVSPLAVGVVHLVKEAEHEDSAVTMLITHADLTQSTMTSSELDFAVHSSNVLSLAILDSSSGPAVVDKLSYCYGPCEETQSLFHEKLPEMAMVLTDALNEALAGTLDSIGCLSEVNPTAMVVLAEATDSEAEEKCL